MMYYSKFTSAKAQKICLALGLTPDYKFVLKSYLKYYSYLFIIALILLSTLLLGLLFRIAEKGTNKDENNFGYIWNSFWVIIITMTTVGYGDVYPVTHLGRLVTIIACIVGAIVLTFLVNAMTNTLEMKPKEGKVSRQIQKMNDIQRHLRSDAQSIISTYLRMIVLRKRRIHEKEKILKTSVSKQSF